MQCIKLHILKFVVTDLLQDGSPQESETRLRIERRFSAALIILLIVGAGVILWSVPLNRVLFSSADMDPPFYPDYLFGSFIVTEADTGIQDPTVKVAADLNRDEAYIDFVIQFCLLNYTLEQLEQVSNISTLVGDEQAVGYYWFSTELPTVEFPLPNIPCTYVWVLWIEVESIPETWTLDLSLTLKSSII